jgi:hypothetical protein
MQQIEIAEGDLVWRITVGLDSVTVSRAGESVLGE